MSGFARKLQRSSSSGIASAGSRPGDNAGADTDASWPLPASNFVVWNPTSGNDANAGTVAAPVKTLASALSKISAGGTVVVRGGTHTGAEVGYRVTSAASYNASLGYAGLPITKQATIQPYPGEHPVFDGTRDESGGWSESSGVWSKNIVITVDHSATYTYGQLDNNMESGWKWVKDAAWHTWAMNAGATSAQATAYPLASWNEQVYIDDVAQEQVATLGEVAPGKFYVAGTNGGTNNLMRTSSAYHLGTNPTGKTVRIGELCTSLNMQQANSTIRGIEFRNFIGSTHMGGVIKATAANTTIEDCIIRAPSSTGITCYNSAGITIRRSEVWDAGILGITHSSTDNLMVDRVKVRGSNSHHYNWAPVSGGIKGHTSRGVTVRDSDFTYNNCTALWWDVSNYDVKVISSALDWNEISGPVFEIGAKALLANCTITHSGTYAFVALDQHDVRVWNCTFSHTGRLRGQVWPDGNSPRDTRIYADNRRLMDSPPYGPGTGLYPGYGRDNRQSQPDATMNNWLPQSNEIKNCIFAPGDKQFAYISIEDLQKAQNESRDWTEWGIVSDGNLFNRLPAPWTSSNPQWAFLLPGTGNNQTIIQNLSAFATWKSTTGQDGNSREVIGPSVCGEDGWLTPEAKALYGRGGAECPAVPLPADIAALIGQPVGDRHVGAYI